MLRKKFYGAWNLSEIKGMLRKCYNNIKTAFLTATLPEVPIRNQLEMFRQRFLVTLKQTIFGAHLDHIPLSTVGKELYYAFVLLLLSNMDELSFLNELRINVVTVLLFDNKLLAD